VSWEAASHLFRSWPRRPRKASCGGSQARAGAIATATEGRDLRIERYWDVEFTPTTAQPKTSSSSSSASCSSNR
jgi:hypothetical protein